MVWFMAVVILGKGSPLLALRLHFVSCRRGVAGVGVGRIAGGLSAVAATIFFVAVLCCRAGRSVAVAVAVWWFRSAFPSLGGPGLVLQLACSLAPS